MLFPPTLSEQDAKTLIYVTDKRIKYKEERSNRNPDVRAKRPYWKCDGCGSECNNSLTSCSICNKINKWERPGNKRRPENPDNPGCWGTPKSIPFAGATLLGRIALAMGWVAVSLCAIYLVIWIVSAFF